MNPTHLVIWGNASSSFPTCRTTGWKKGTTHMKVCLSGGSLNSEPKDSGSICEILQKHNPKPVFSFVKQLPDLLASQAYLRMNMKAFTSSSIKFRPVGFFCILAPLFSLVFFFSVQISELTMWSTPRWIQERGSHTG